MAVVALLLPAAFPGHTETPREGLGAQPLAGPALPVGFLPQPYNFAKPWGFAKVCMGRVRRGWSEHRPRAVPRVPHAAPALRLASYLSVPVFPCLCRLLAMGRVGVQGGVSVTPIWACKMGTKLWLGGTEP